MGVRCFDVANMVICDANERFAPLFALDNKKLDIFKQYCDAIDNIISDFDGESIDVEVDEDNMNVSIHIECSDMTIEDKKHIYYELIRKTVSFGFSATKNDTIIVEFVFPPLWTSTM